jgi:hypothetical protein
VPRPLLTLTSALALLALSAPPALAQSPTAPTLDAALSAAFAQTSLEGLTALTTRGASYEGLLVAEALPDGAVLAEVSLSIDGVKARYPLRLTRTSAGWTVSWAPDPAYAQALFAFLTSDTLPLAGPNAPGWTRTPRVPALPVLLTQRSAVTPFGSVAMPAPDPRDPTALQPVAGLADHARRWLSEVTARDPGLANIDLLGDARVDWRLTQQSLLSVASEGLFRVHLIGRSPADGSRELTSTQGSLPVVRFGKDGRPHPLVLALYPQADDLSWRVSYTGKVLPPDDSACHPESSFCASTAIALSRRLAALATSMRAKNPDAAQAVMFAAPGEVTLAQALPWISEVTAPFGLTADSLFIGYVKR